MSRRTAARLARFDIPRIRFTEVTQRFRVIHERSDTLREAFARLLRRERGELAHQRRAQRLVHQVGGGVAPGDRPAPVDVHLGVRLVPGPHRPGDDLRPVHGEAGHRLLDVDDLEQRVAGLGRRFYAEVRRTENLIARFPESSQELSPGLRKRALRTFPFSLIYSIEKDGLLILAVAHQRRRPGYWVGRTESSNIG